MKFIFAASLALAAIGYTSAAGIRLAPENRVCKCTLEFRPVCVFGQTFGNRCFAKCKYPGLEEANINEGKCRQKLCICTADYNPVCYNGKTFSNACVAKCQGVPESDIIKGKCVPQKLSAPLCRCTKEYFPVCFNGVTYGNRCMAKCYGASEEEISVGKC